MKKILPAEWYRQSFIQLTWPHKDTDWAYMLDEVNQCFVDIARNIIDYQDLLIVCREEHIVRELLAGLPLERIRFVELSSDDTWARDHGGIIVLENGKPVVYDFAFNGWGEKFAYDLDNQLTAQLYQMGVLEMMWLIAIALILCWKAEVLSRTGKGLY